jgi:hypothetical protein
MTLDGYGTVGFGCLTVPDPKLVARLAGKLVGKYKRAARPGLSVRT